MAWCGAGDLYRILRDDDPYDTRDKFRTVTIPSARVSSPWLLYACRADDVLVHTSGEMTNPHPTEDKIKSLCPGGVQTSRRESRTTVRWRRCGRLDAVTPHDARSAPASPSPTRQGRAQALPWGGIDGDVPPLAIRVLRHTPGNRAARRRVSTPQRVGDRSPRRSATPRAGLRPPLHGTNAPPSPASEASTCRIGRRWADRPEGDAGR